MQTTSSHSDFGSNILNEIVARLQSTNDKKKRYEYVLWLAKKLPELPEEFHQKSIKVQGCISQVYVFGKLDNGKIYWQGYSDALITKGLLALLIEGLNNLTPQEVLEINPGFIEATQLNASLTPSRANGFLNILKHMQAQANFLNTD